MAFYFATVAFSQVSHSAHAWELLPAPAHGFLELHAPLPRPHRGAQGLRDLCFGLHLGAVQLLGQAGHARIHPFVGVVIVSDGLLEVLPHLDALHLLPLCDCVAGDLGFRV